MLACFLPLQGFFELPFLTTMGVTEAREIVSVYHARLAPELSAKSGYPVCA